MIKNIGIIGAGQMGCGIAHVSASAGYKVHIYDVTQDRIDAGLATINGNLARQVSHGKMTEEQRNAALALISGSSDTNDLAPMDLVIEAATEDESVKRKIYAQICPVLKPEAILATNTSSLSITRLASATDRPERFMGIHFMNPVPVMKLVELVRGIATLPREAIVALTAAGRPMFVPVVALNLLYDAGAGTPGQTTAAFAIGVERPDGGKLGPLWLDEPARMHDAIGIRAHGTTVKR